MAYIGKIIGGAAGFFMGGPFGALVGAALGHAADTGAISNLKFPSGLFGATRTASLLGRRDQLFSVTVIILSARVARSDGPVKREEIDTFKRLFRIAPSAARDVGRLFDQARDGTDEIRPYAEQLGEAFADNRGTLTEVLTALVAIARADGPVNQREHAMLREIHRGFGLDQPAWDLAWNGVPARPVSSEPDPYTVLGVSPSSSADVIRARWRELVRENHPDGLTARGVPAEFVAKATEKVAKINAAWDRIKRERGL